MKSGTLAAAQSLLKLWFGFRTPVSRRAYALTGFSLMALKYAVDFTWIYQTTGQIWTPVRYWSPFWSHRFVGVELSDLWVLGLWTVPFVWIGASMTARRALDAGLSPAWGLLFFVPLLNYILMSILCMTRSYPVNPPQQTAKSESFRFDSSSGTAILVACALGLGVLGISLGFSSGAYAYGLFLGTPFAMGFVAAFLYDRKGRHSPIASMLVVQTGVVVLGGFFLLAGIEGLICLLMAYPLAGGIALVGGILGQQMAPARGLAGSQFAAILILAPLMPFLDEARPPPPMREVITSIEIDASPQEVWSHLVAFSELPEPSHLIFRMGIAHPRRALIDGHGVGAVRYCEFSTGPFVEPITRWDEPFRLSFDVIEQPPTMEEWSPYKITPPHVTRSFRSQRGEFRLVPLSGGRTRLEGSTWYELELYPQSYWSLWSNWLLHSIHQQVLDHIKIETERSSA